MSETFFAILSRMKYIERWALMRSSRSESLSEHSLEVAMLSHALCTIGNVRLGKHLHAERAALIGLYHDAAEIITGDMPTPVKYGNRNMRSAYEDTERQAVGRLLETLPEDLRPVWEGILMPASSAPAPSGAGNEGRTEDPGRAGNEGRTESPDRTGNEGRIEDPDRADDRYLLRLVKAADKLSALIKCIEEETAGNREFRTAMQSTQAAIDRLRAELPEVDIFVREFLPPYGSTLDELLAGD